MDLFNILQKLQAIGQVSEATDKCDDCGEVHEGACTKSAMKEADMEEGNEFSGALKAAKDAGKDEFEVAGKKYKVNEAEEKCEDCGKPESKCECEGHDHSEKVAEAKKPDADKDGVPDWADKKPGADDNEEKVDEGMMDKVKAFGKKALDTLGHGDDEAMIKDLQRKMGLPQTGKKPEAQPEKQVKESEMDLLRRLAGLQECGDMDQMAQMSPMSSVSDMATPVQVIQSPDAEMAAGQEQPEMSQEPEQEPARYTLTISNGDSNLSMTTDVPDEIIHIMKLAGVNKGAEVTKAPAEQGGEKEVEEAWGNTPTATKEKEPHAYGDIRDWAMKGTGAGKAGSAANKPYGSGDNPLSEDAILGDYKLFKSSK